MAVEIAIENGTAGGDGAFFEEVADAFHAEANGGVCLFERVDVRRGPLWNSRDILFDFGCEFSGISGVMDKATIDEG